MAGSVAGSLFSKLTVTSSLYRSFAFSAHSSRCRASSLLRLRPLIALVESNRGSASVGLRHLATRATTSSLNDASPNWSNRPPKETILLDGCDFEHWLVVMEKPDENATRNEIIDSYIKTLAKVVGSEEEARMKIYSVSTQCYFAFGALVSEELSYKIKELPGVRWVLPDSYLDVKNKDYGGEPFINGEAVPYDPKYHEEWRRNHARAQERNRKNDRPRSYDRSRNFERRRENMQNRDIQFNTSQMLNRDVPSVSNARDGPGVGGMPVSSYPNQGTSGSFTPVQQNSGSSSIPSPGQTLAASSTPSVQHSLGMSSSGIPGQPMRSAPSVPQNLGISSPNAPAQQNQSLSGPPSMGFQAQGPISQPYQSSTHGPPGPVYQSPSTSSISNSNYPTTGGPPNASFQSQGPGSTSSLGYQAQGVSAPPNMGYQGRTLSGHPNLGYQGQAMAGNMGYQSPGMGAPSLGYQNQGTGAPNLGYQNQGMGSATNLSNQNPGMGGPAYPGYQNQGPAGATNLGQQSQGLGGASYPGYQPHGMGGSANYQGQGMGGSSSLGYQKQPHNTNQGSYGSNQTHNMDNALNRSNQSNSFPVGEVTSKGSTAGEARDIPGRDMPRRDY